MISRRAPVVALMCALAASTLLGCKSSSGRSATPSIPGIVQTVLAGIIDATPTAPGREDIRTIDLEHTTSVQKLLADNGGEFVQSNVIYADLTGDGVDEAIVPISSGGTLGDVAYVVLTPGSAGVSELLTSAPGRANEGGVAVAVVDGKLVETRPVYAPEDPNCCPSMFRRTTFAWDGTTLTQESSETTSNPAGFKGTPPPAAPTANQQQ